MYTIKNFNKGYVEYTIVLDQTVSTPASMISKSVSQKEILEFIGAYPVLLDNDGKEYKKLKKTNLQQFEDGTDASSYTSSTNYDVMVKFPRRGYNISTVNDKTTIKLTDNPNASGYVYYPRQRIESGNLGASGAVYVDVDAFYLGAYKGVNSSGLRSWYNQTPTVSQAIGKFTGYAKNRGSNWGLTEFVQETYLEICFMAIFGTTNAQAALGRGYVDASGNSYPGPKTGVNTYNQVGSTTLSGAVEGCYGTSSGTTPVSFLWLEHRYGGIWEWVLGWGQTSSGIYISIPNSDGSNRTSTYSYQPTNCSAVHSSISLTNSAYITKVKGDNLCGFTPTGNSGGSDSTYFTDCARGSSNSHVATFGGFWDDTSRCGAFCWHLNFGASSSDAGIGSRLSFLPSV